MIPVFGDVPELPATSRPKRLLAVATILLGITSVGIMIWWQQGGDGPPRFEELTGGALNFDAEGSTSLEELHARTQILGVRVGQIQKALTAGNPDADTEPVVIPELPQIPRMPFVPFEQRRLTDKEQSQADDLLRKYSTLYNNGGADGRNHDAATVKTYTEYLKQLITMVDARGESRSDVLHELSELTKLVYLLQLRNLKADDSEAAAAAAIEVLQAADSGLRVVYTEIQTGDMRFADVFEREAHPERARLLLIRYWPEWPSLRW